MWYEGKKDGSTFGIANIYDKGLLYNCIFQFREGDVSTVDTVNLFGGTVLNSSRINEMNYFGGEYKREPVWDWFYENGEREYGYDNIGTLTLAGRATGIDWGVVENLQFSDNGSGILAISAFADGGFSGIQVMKSADLSHGNIWLDLGGMGAFSESWEDTFTSLFADGFSLADLFGLESVDGSEGLKSFTVFWGSDFDQWFTILHDGALVNDDWDITGRVITWNGNVDNVSWATPEPGTLAVLGLGLAGLAAARRRRKQ